MEFLKVSLLFFDELNLNGLKIEGFILAGLITINAACILFLISWWRSKKVYFP